MIRALNRTTNNVNECHIKHMLKMGSERYFKNLHSDAR